MKNAMIWGAGGGIGRALTRHLSAAGWTVIAVTHRPTRPDDAAHYFDANAADPYEVQLAVNGAAQLVDDINLWIYAAGDIAQAKVAELAPAAVNRLVAANLTGPLITTHFSEPLLAPNAHLMYLGAISERLRLPGLAAYAATKAGLEAFADALAKEQRRRRVSVVRPAAVDTPFWNKVSLRLPAAALSPDDLAHRMIEAHHQDHRGVLDIA